jgi:type IV secretory pathway VirJ component
MATGAVLAILAAWSVLGSADALAASKKGATRTVPVTTSRGDFEMIVYPPATPDPAPNAPADPRGPRPIVLIASGEFGWRRFDDVISAMLAAQGYWVGGIDAMKYFWEAQDDRQALSADLKAFADALAKTAGREARTPLILGGFSFGADLAPWVAGAGGWQDRLRGLLMIGPDETGSLLFRISEMIGFKPKDHIFSVAEALKSAAGYPVLLIHGGKDSVSAGPMLAENASEPKKLIVVEGASHHFSGREEPLREALREGMLWLERQSRGPGAPGSKP